MNVILMGMEVAEQKGKTNTVCATKRLPVQELVQWHDYVLQWREDWPAADGWVVTVKCLLQITDTLLIYSSFKR